MRNALLAGMLVFCAMHGAMAAPDEIQVYTEELDAPGTFGLEQHLNYTLEGQRRPDYPGQMVPHHVVQATPEFSYGLTDALEAGLYVPFALTPSGDTFINGLRARLKYIAPRESDDGVFHGMNVEIGRESRRVSDSISGLELRPIIGYRGSRWLVSFNPVLTIGLAAGVSHQPQFEPSLKVTRGLSQGVRGGVEYYGSYGSLMRMPSADQRAHTLYAVADMGASGWDLNFGIGRGFVNAADAWVMKAIVALPLL